MAQFIAYIKGSKGGVSRLGHKTTGIRATANGWNVGARIEIRYNEETGEDVVRVFRTKGSNGPSYDDVEIAQFTSGDVKPRKKKPAKVRRSRLALKVTDDYVPLKDQPGT